MLHAVRIGRRQKIQARLPRYLKRKKRTSEHLWEPTLRVRGFGPEGLPTVRQRRLCSNRGQPVSLVMIED